MPRIQILANEFRDNEDSQSPLLVERFGPAWYMNGSVGETLAVSAVPMPAGWDGDPIKVYIFGQLDYGSLELTIEAMVTNNYGGSEAYGSPVNADLYAAAGSFRIYGPYEVTPSIDGTGEMFLAIRIKRNNEVDSPTSLAFKSVLIEYTQT